MEEQLWFNEYSTDPMLPRSVNLSELTSLLWRLQWSIDEECADIALFHAPQECYGLIGDRYIRTYQRILEAYDLSGNDLIDILEDRVPGWAYRAGFHIPIEVTGVTS